MTSAVGDVIHRLSVAIEAFDEAGMIAVRAQSDARELVARLTRTSRGSDHPLVREATVNAQEAIDKAGKVARLYAEAAAAYVAYAELIAPGGGAVRDMSPAVPDGLRLSEPSSKGSRFDRLLRETVNRAEDTKDGLDEVAKGISNAAKAAGRYTKRLPGPPAGSAGTSTPRVEPAHPIRTTAYEGIASVTMATVAFVYGARAAAALFRRRRRKAAR